MKVLIIEDNLKYQNRWRSALEQLKIRVISATSIEEGRNAIVRERFDLVAVDACVPGNQVNTLGLVRDIRRGFSGPMIAISSSQEYRIELLSAGCDHACRKELLFGEIVRLLGDMYRR